MPKYLGTVVYDSDLDEWTVEAGLPGTAVPPVAGDDIVSGTLTVAALLTVHSVDGEEHEVGDRGRRFDAETGQRLDSKGEPAGDDDEAGTRGRRVTATTRTQPVKATAPATKPADKS